MDKKANTVPKFNSVKEEAKFWDTHSVTDYWEEAKEVAVSYIPPDEKKETMTLRMAPSLKAEIEKVARGYDISTSSLIRMWLVDRLREIKSTESSRVR
jgi:hypothetical protein